MEKIKVLDTGYEKTQKWLTGLTAHWYPDHKEN